MNRIYIQATDVGDFFQRLPRVDDILSKPLLVRHGVLALSYASVAAYGGGRAKTIDLINIQPGQVVSPFKRALTKCIAAGIAIQP